MLTIAGRIILALVIAMIATPAWGECAWVVWSQTAKGTLLRQTQPTPWSPMAAERTKEDCESYISRILKGLPGERLGVWIGKDEQGKDYIGNFKCLPDTVDPRK